MIKNNRKFSELFYNNRFLLIFSVVTAVIIWLVVAVEFSPETKVTIKNVPIRVASTGIKDSMKLEAFGADNLTVDVTIVGKRYIVEDDDIINDIDVTANTGSVTRAGTYNLSVDVGSVSTRPQYEIVSYSVSEIEVLFDYYVEKQVPVEPQITVENGGLAADGYFADELSPEVNKITVYGPKSEVDSIMKIDALASVNGNMTESGGFNASLKLVKENGDTPKHVGIKAVTGEMASGNIYINAFIYKEATAVPVVNFTDIPAGYDENNLPVEWTIEPAEVIFGFTDTVKTDVTVATVSFNDLDFGKENSIEITKDFSGKEGVVVKDSETGQAGTVTFKITLTNKNIGYKNISLPSAENPYYIAAVNNKNNLQYEVVSYGTRAGVSINGPVNSVNAITQDDLRLDFSNVSSDATGVFEVPVILDNDLCWLTDDEDSVFTVKVKIINQ